MRYRGPKARLCRREGVNLFASEKYQKILARRPGIPGMHGAKRQGKVTEYARQLREKQKLKRMYELSEKQFRKSVDKAERSKLVTGDALLIELESRLDNAVFRAGLSMTRAQSRQFVSHGIFTLNGRRVNIPSIKVKAGDLVEVRESKKKSPVFTQNIETLGDYKAPSWIKADTSKRKFEVLKTPEPAEAEVLVETRLIVEFYSR